MSQQGSLGDYPVPGNPPEPYMLGADAYSALQTRYPQFVPSGGSIPDALMLVASMRLDEEGPFQGVKMDVTQDRAWPRTFRYGWPNVIATPDPLLVAESYPGAWNLAYDSVVPQQILDWCCLEAYRLLTVDQLQVVTQESISGASVKYAPGVDYPKGQMAALDLIQAALLSPFQLRQGFTVPFIFWPGF